MREQLNTLTAFIDVGQVYAADEKLARELRDLTTDEGLMRVNERFTDNGRELLPFSGNEFMCRNRRNITGDNSAEEVPCSLAGMYFHMGLCLCLLICLGGLPSSFRLAAHCV